MSMDDNRLKDFLTAEEISRCLRIPLNTIYRLSKQGVIKGVKIGKQWRYNKSELEKYLAGEMSLRNVHLERFEERRAYPRMNCHFKCGSRINIEEMTDVCLANGHVTNISAGGLFLELKNDCFNSAVRVGDPIDMNFGLVSDLDGSLHDIYAKGRIVRKAYTGVGVKFRHIDEKYKDLITQFVD